MPQITSTGDCKTLDRGMLGVLIDMYPIPGHGKVVPFWVCLVSLDFGFEIWSPKLEGPGWLGEDPHARKNAQHLYNGD